MPEAITNKPFYVRVALVGLAMFAVVILLFFFASIAVGDGEGVIFTLIIGAVLGVILFLTLRGGKWPYIAAALLCVLGLLFFAPSVPEGIQSPDSFLDFASNLLGLTGLLIAAIALTIAFIKERSGSNQQTGPAMTVRALQAIVGVVVVASLASLVLTLVSIDTVSASDKEGATQVSAKASKWSTDSITADSSGTLKLVVKNSDPYVHTFTVEDLNVDFKLGPGSEKLIVLEKPLAGTYIFKCAISGHESMKGTLTVQ